MNSLESLYGAIKYHNDSSKKASLIIGLRSWLVGVCDFDPVTGNSLHTSVAEFINIETQEKGLESSTRDRIYRIACHVEEPIKEILKHIRNKILREHAMLPIHAAREFDSTSIQWLSRQPGRTVREKLSGKPYIKAVKRRHSADTLENRLLKVFLIKFENILIERQSALELNSEEGFGDLIVLIQRWVRSEDFVEIGDWENTLPNNALLQDKQYRKIWDAWLWIQLIDSNVLKDSDNINHDIISVLYWSVLSLLDNTGIFRLVQQPLKIDYDEFTIISRMLVENRLFLEKKSGDKNKSNDKSFLFQPKEISVEVFNDELKVCLEENELLVQINDESVSLTEKSKNIDKKIDLNLTAILEDVPREIVSIFTGIDLTKSLEEKKTVKLDCADVLSIDLCSIQPAFSSNGSCSILPFKLIHQYWDDEKTIVNCAKAKAIRLGDNVQTISIRTLFSGNSDISEVDKSKSAMFFARSLSAYALTKEVIYLTPDPSNDFDLEYVRKSMNFYFKNSTPLPRSISSIFAWQSSNQFKKIKVANSDTVLVVDEFDGDISITPIQAVKQEGLDGVLPSTKGITWDRHPSFIVEDSGINKKMAKVLFQGKYQKLSTEVVDLLGYEGVVNNAGKLSFVDNNGWHNLTHSIGDILKQNLSEKFLTRKMIKDCMNSLSRDCESSRVLVLPINNVIRCGEELKGYHVINSPSDIAEGGVTLHKWQKKVLDIPLWRDHLPKLSIPGIVRNGVYENFYLVKNKTVAPQRGRSVEIPVEDYFTLPAGKEYYIFPLQQGEEGKGLEYVAYLTSQDFPLTEEIDCKLKMTYAYGDDDPYKLRFIPLNMSNIVIRTEWRLASEDKGCDLANLPFPDFPICKSWSDLQSFPNNKGETTNLLDWAIQEMRKICNIEEYGRVSAVVTELKIDHCSAGGVRIRKSDFENNQLPKMDEEIDFYKIVDYAGNFVGKDATASGTDPKNCFLQKSLRFPMINIWNGHSIFDLDIPDSFKSEIQVAIKAALSLRESEDVPQSLKEEILLFLSYLHEGAPDEVQELFLKAIHNRGLIGKYDRNIAYIIGDAKLPVQKKLLGNVIKLIKEKERGWLVSAAMTILSISFWRSEELICQLKEKEIKVLIDGLYKRIELDVENIRDKKGKKSADLCRHLELLLALTRTRKNKNEKIQALLAPHRKLTKDYIKLIDGISGGGTISIESWIDIQIKKPKEFKNTHDLLYALRCYLAGDVEPNSIQIKSINSDY